MFYFSSDESEEEQPRSTNSSDSVGSCIDNFEDTLENEEWVVLCDVVF